MTSIQPKSCPDDRFEELKRLVAHRLSLSYFLAEGDTNS
jgi:hypothetical protein